MVSISKSFIHFKKALRLCEMYEESGYRVEEIEGIEY